MATVTRASRKLKEEESTKGAYGLRKSVRETPSMKQKSSSALNKLRSEKQEKQTSTPAKRKSDRVEKKKAQSISSRSERSEKRNSSSSSSSKKSGKISGSVGSKNKKKSKVKRGKQTTVSGGERRRGDKQDQTLADVISKKKKRLLDARSYRALLKPPRKKAKLTDLGTRQRQDNSSEGNSAIEETSCSTEVGAGLDECSDKTGEEQRRKDLCSGVEEGVEDSSSGSDELADGCSRNDTEDSAECRDGNSHECNAKLGDETGGKDLEESKEDTMVCKSLGSKQIASGISMNINGDTESYYLRRKRKFCLDHRDSKFEDRTSLSRNSDGSLESSSVDLITSETVDDTGTAVISCLAEGNLKDPGQNANRVFRGEDVRPLKDSDKASVREDLMPFQDCILPSLDATQPVAAEVVLEQSDTVKAFQKKKNASDEVPKLSSGAIHDSNQDTPADPIMSFAEKNYGQLNDRCADCFKYRSCRMDLDPDKQEVCFCNATNNDSYNISLSKDREKLESTGSIVEDCHRITSSLGVSTGSDCNACVVCKLGGKLLCCDGNGCRRSFHLSCLDPPLNDVPYGVWHCFLCVKKKLESGVHSVSEGVESVWDSREVEVFNNEVMLKEKQYFVKFKGLAHVHNQWIRESQLVSEAPVLIAKYKRRSQKEKTMRWKSEWMLPQRLVQKRLLMTSKQADEYISEHGTDSLNIRYEWLVKWNGLGYEHATWEMENAQFWSLPEAVERVKDYENRHEKAINASDPSHSQTHKERKNPFYELPSLPNGCPSDNDHLSFVNKLRECWHKCQSAIVIDDQERIVVVLSFIVSLRYIVYRPFLIITTATTLPVWEAELMHLAPSMNSVIYSGNMNVRKFIQELEFYDKSGCVMFQVLISPIDAIIEDLETMNCIEWEAVIVDDCQQSRVAKHYEQIRMLAKDFRLLLAGGHIKDNVHDYQNLLSFLELGDGEHPADSKSDSNDSPTALPALKERLSRYIAYERKADTSKFIEYWVPVYLSTVQLEKYCATLLSNSSCLCSYSKSDQVGALIEMLMSTRKCCDHPYLVDSSLQSMLTKGHPEVEYLDIGVNASGKLKLLDNFLQEIKKRGLRVLILFQALASIGGSGRIHIGDILDDFLRQRFGPDSYERVDSGIIASKKQAAMNKFNNKEMGRFVFLIESRACQPSIKLTAVDAVIIFGSDWNPLNDLRSLQRISFELHAEQLKLYRFYSTCTVEEKLLMLSKQDMSLDSNIRSVSRGTSHTLLRWGASHLFNRLDEFHGLSTPNSSSVTCDQSLLDEVVVDMLALLPRNGVEDNKLYNCSAIKRAQHSGTNYSRNISIFGELRMQSTEEEQPHVFWKKLLGGRYPQWRYWSAPSPRARKKVQYLDELPKWRESENEEARKKRKKGSNNNWNPISSKSCSDDKRKPLSSDKEAVVAVIKTVATSSCEPSSVNPKKALGSCAPTRDSGECRSRGNNDHDYATSSTHLIPEASVANKIESEGRKKLRDAQRSLHLFLEPEIGKLCSTAQLPVYIKHLAKKFLEYIMNNHHVSREPVTILQAFQIALCWTAASFLKYKVDHKESLALARQHLNFKCKDEEAESVYSKLKMLKKRFAHQMDEPSTSFMPASKEDEVSAVRNDGVAPAKSSEGTASNSRDLEEGEIREYSPGKRLSTRVPVEQDQVSECGKSGTGTRTGGYVNSPHINAKEPWDPVLIDKRVKCVDKVCFQRTNEMLLKQQEEIGKFIQFRERERKRLTEEHRIESDLIIRTHNDPFVRSEKLKTLDASYLKKRSDFDRRMVDWQRKIITAQQAARDKEKQIRAQWLEEARSGQLSESFSKHPLPDTRLMLKKMETGEQNVGNSIPDTVFSLVLPSHLNNANSSGFKPVELAVSGKSVDGAAVMSQGIEEGNSVGNSASQSMSRNAANSNVLKNITSEGPSGGDSGVHIQINSPIIAETHPSFSPSVDTSATVLKEQSKDDAGFFTNSNVNKTIQDLPTVAEPQTSTRQSVDSLARVLNERTKNNASLCRQSSILNGINHESGGLENSVSKRQLEGGSRVGSCPIVRPESGGMEKVGLGRPNDADDAHCSSPASSLQPLQIELPTSDQSNSCFDHVIALSSRHMPTTDHNQPHTSGDMQSHGRLSSPLGEVPAQCTVDVVSSQAAPSDDNGSASQSNLLMQLDGSPVRHNQLPASAVRSEDESSREAHNSYQAEAPIQQPPEGLLSQTLQNNFLMSESTSAQSPLPVFLDIPQREMPMASHGSSSGGIQEPSNRPPQNLTSTYFQMRFAGPLQNELNKIRKEEEKATKMHEDEKTRLKGEFEREIEEVHRKYNGLMLDSEMVFQQRLKELQINYSKVSKNLLLAEACRLMLSDTSKSRVAAPRQGLPFTSLVQSMPSVQHTVQQPVSVQTPVHPLQIVRHPPAFSSGNQAGPHISQIAPPVNIPIGAELRAPAPHLQPFRPTSMPGASHPLSRMPSLQRRNNALSSQLLQPPVSVCPPTGTPGATTLPNDTSSSPNFHCRSISAMDLLTDINQQSGNNFLNLPPLTQLGFSFDSLVPNNLTTGCSGQVASTLETTCLSTGTDVITVSDDD